MKTRLKDMTGKIFGRLTVIGRAQDNRAEARWICLCDCGQQTKTAGSQLRLGRTQSCGCLNADNMRAKMTTHGKRDTDTYRIWTQMLTRTRNKNYRKYEDYGGRGIQVCERWLTFENFLTDMGERPDGMSIDRYPDNNGNYEPGNCRWATLSQQARNTRCTIRVVFQGQSISLHDACEIAGISFATAFARARRGWPQDRWLEVPKYARK